MFEKLSSRNEGAFVPFVAIGDPNLDVSQKIIETLIESGADALELGIPYSDPIADGPTIQKASIRAIESGATPPKCIQLVKSIRKKHPEIPIGLLLYSNLVVSQGIDEFYQSVQNAGIDSLLYADVPSLESQLFCHAAEKWNVLPIYIAPPNAKDQTLRLIAEQGKGYTYLLSRAGVTGTETEANIPIDHIINKLKEFNAPPPLLGFGISKPEHVKSAIENGAAGAICGSAITKIIEKNIGTEKVFEELTQFVRSMKNATKK